MHFYKRLKSQKIVITTLGREDGKGEIKERRRGRGDCKGEMKEGRRGRGDLTVKLGGSLEVVGVVR